MRRARNAEKSGFSVVGRLAVLMSLGLAATGMVVMPPDTASAQTNDPVVVQVDRATPTGTFAMAVGETHTQYSLEASGDAAAVAAGSQLLSEAVSIQNQHLYGWGALNPNPSPGVYNWASLDRRVELMRDIGGTPVVTLCCAPDWMTELGTETSLYRNRPPTARHYADFADLAVKAAQRYPDVRHWVVWNEMKGFWNPGTAQWDYVAYTEMYNAVYDALKDHDPSLQVGGPYLVIESTGSELGGWVTEMPVTQRNRVFLEYWMANANGADFVAIDRKVKDYHDTRDYTEAESLALTANFATVASEVGDLTGLPVWFIEQHFVGQRGGPVHFQAAGIASMLYHQLRGGAVASVGWKPEQDDPVKRIQENLYTSTQVAGGGQILPPYWSYRFFNESFPPGTPRYDATSSDSLVLVLASADATVLINQHPDAIIVDLDGTTVQLAGYEVARFDPSGTPTGSSTQALGDGDLGALAAPAAADVVAYDATGGEIDAGPENSPDARAADLRLLEAQVAEAQIAEAQNADAAAAAAGPGLAWLTQEGTDQSDRFNDASALGSGVVVGGTTWGELRTGQARGRSDGFVSRYSASGQQVWSNQFGNPFDQGIGGVTADHVGVYAVGTSDSGIAGQSHLGAFDATIRAYDRNGRVQWTRQFGTAGDDHAIAVVSHRDVVYVAGHTDGQFDGQSLAGASDAFLVAFSRSGELLWARQYGSPNPDHFADLAVDGDTLVAAGFTAGGFGGETAIGHWDAFVSRFDLSGAMLWTDQFGSIWDDRAYGVAVSDDGIHVVGRTEDGLDEPFVGIYDAYVRTYRRDGTVRWTTSTGTAYDDRFAAVAADPSGIHVFGSTTGAYSGHASAGSADNVVAQYDHDGTLLWLDQFGSNGLEEPTAIVTDLGNRYISGSTQGPLPGQTAFGGRDGFAGRVGANLSVAAGDTFTRNTTDTWGTTSVGGGWQVFPRANFSAGDGTGNISVLGGTGEQIANLRGVAIADVDLQFTVTLDALPTGGSAYLYAVARKVGANEYRARIRIKPDGSVSMRAIRREGSWISLGSNVDPPTFRVEPGRPFRFGFQVMGTGTTELRARIWQEGTDRPDWQLAVTDTGSGLTGPGAVGVRALAVSSATDITVSVDDLSAVAPR